MTTRRITALLLALVMLLAFAACKQNGGRSRENADLSACAKNYLKSMELSDDTVSEIIGKLSVGTAD